LVRSPAGQLRTYPGPVASPIVVSRGLRSSPRTRPKPARRTRATSRTGWSPAVLLPRRPALHAKRRQSAGSTFPGAMGRLGFAGGGPKSWSHVSSVRYRCAVIVVAPFLPTSRQASAQPVSGRDVSRGPVGTGSPHHRSAPPSEPQLPKVRDESVRIGPAWPASRPPPESTAVTRAPWSAAARESAASRGRPAGLSPRNRPSAPGPRRSAIPAPGVNPAFQASAHHARPASAASPAVCPADPQRDVCPPTVKPSPSATRPRDPRQVLVGGAGRGRGNWTPSRLPKTPPPAPRPTPTSRGPSGRRPEGSLRLAAIPGEQQPGSG